MLADSLKNTLTSIFGWDRKRMDSINEEDRIWKESIDLYWSKRLNMPHLSPRWTLQNIGTEVMRTYFHPEIWIASAEKKIIDLPETIDKVVLSDCRLANEKKYIDDMDGLIFRVHRDSITMIDTHITELEFLAFEGDNIIDIYNNGSIEDLESQLETILPKYGYFKK